MPNEHGPAVLAFLGERPSTTAVATPFKPIDEDALVTDQEAIDGWTEENLINFFEMRTKGSIVGRTIAPLPLRSPRTAL
ncbi:hypothetical protein [Pseudarthrobacter enclensis]|uniref:hypothetical protein n=1 Tax=Pseudarthrobacter enclensis TaxID=993070 RepID=UPI00114625D6|nr:hypothetical protein [Pseudarthrobacter enclensis]